MKAFGSNGNRIIWDDRLANTLEDDEFSYADRLKNLFRNQSVNVAYVWQKDTSGIIKQAQVSLKNRAKLIHIPIVTDMYKLNELAKFYSINDFALSVNFEVKDFKNF